MLSNSHVYLVYYAVFGLIFSIIVTKMSIKLKVIRKSASITSIITGLLVSLSGLISVTIFLVFLTYCSIVTRIGVNRKRELNLDYDILGRNSKQVIAVGFPPAILSLLATITYVLHLPSLCRVLLTLYLTSLATSCADTFASEIGVLSKSKPRLITNLRYVVDVGTSGGITMLGELSSILGATLIAISSYLVVKYLNLLPSPWIYLKEVNLLKLTLIVLVCGYLGEVFDSIYGALLQPKYYCSKCNVITEFQKHICGFNTIKIYGRDKICNEIINVLSILTTIPITIYLTYTYL